MGKKQKSRYCYGCLKKFKKGEASGLSDCPYCGGEIRRVKNVRTRAQVVTRLSRLRGVAPMPKGRKGYRLYLSSSLWRTIRGRVLERDDHTCQDCGAPAEQVHHLSYAPEVMAGQDDSQLVSLCGPCHEKKHPDKARKKRGPAKPRTAKVGN